MKKKSSKPTSDKKESWEYHELHDYIPKLLRMVASARIKNLTFSALAVYAVIVDHWNTKSERPKECFQSWKTLGLKAFMHWQVVKKIAYDLADLGFINLKYRIWEKLADGSGTRPLDFDSYDAAESKRKELERHRLSKGKSPVPLITPPKKLPRPEDFRLYLVNTPDRIYEYRGGYSPTQGMGSIGDESVDQEIETPGFGDSAGVYSGTHQNDGEGIVANRTPATGIDENETQRNPMEGEVTITKVNNNVSHSHVKDFIGSLPSPIQEITNCFVERFKIEFDEEPPLKQLRSVSESSIQDQILENWTAIKGYGGTIEEWVAFDFERLDQHRGSGIYHRPKIEFFAKKHSLDYCLSKLTKHRLLLKVPPVARLFHGQDKEIRNILYLLPDEDAVFIRSLMLAKEFRSAIGTGELRFKLYKHGLGHLKSLELNTKTFAYIGLKHQVHFSKMPMWIFDLIEQFIQESDDPDAKVMMDPGEFLRATEYIKNEFQKH